LNACLYEFGESEGKGERERERERFENASLED
jgi:hypothetical protein